MGIESTWQRPGVLTTRVEWFVNWARANSLWPLAFGTACCAIELMSSMVARYDLARFGSEVVRFSPRQSDLLIVAGRVSAKMMPVLQTVHRQMPEPKWVIAMGACASSGGEFDTYAVVQGVDQFMPVDVYIPGCPPRPETLIEGIMALQRIVERDGLPPRPRQSLGLRIDVPGGSVADLARARRRAIAEGTHRLGS